MADDAEKPPEGKTRSTFSKAMRLRKGPEFQAVFSRRISVSDKSLVVYALANGLSHCRLGLSISKKTTKTAPARNRWKRVLREAFRLDQSHYPMALDLVVLVRMKHAGKMQDVRQALLKQVERVAKRVQSRKDPLNLPTAEKPEEPPP